MEANAASIPETDPQPVLWETQLRPYRSLPPAGFALLMAAVAGVAFVGGLVFFLVGAWPVVGFGGIELGLFYLMFRLNYRSQRRYERLILTPNALTVERGDEGGVLESRSLPPYWLKVEIDAVPEPQSRLTLRSHGREIEIGRFLPPIQRLELAEALRAVLAEQRAKGWA